VSYLDIESLDGETIKQNLLSGDKCLVLSTAHAIIGLATAPIKKRKDLLKPSFDALDEIRKSAIDIDLGGVFLSNSRYLKQALDIIMQNEHDGCACHLAFDQHNDDYTEFELVEPYKKSETDEYCYIGVVECPVCHQRYRIYKTITGWHIPIRIDWEKI
jgi:hypothetical protein